ncbi:hypothetical protein AB0C84_45255 [Actinomadura sp. NPDC048955]
MTAAEWAEMERRMRAAADLSGLPVGAFGDGGPISWRRSDRRIAAPEL